MVVLCVAGGGVLPNQTINSPVNRRSRPDSVNYSPRDEGQTSTTGLARSTRKGTANHNQHTVENTDLAHYELRRGLTLSERHSE